MKNILTILICVFCIAIPNAGFGVSENVECEMSYNQTWKCSNTEYDYTTGRCQEGKGYCGTISTAACDTSGSADLCTSVDVTQCYWDGNKCTEVPKGYYSPPPAYEWDLSGFQGASSVLTKCPSGKTTVGPGKRTVDACYYQATERDPDENGDYTLGSHATCAQLTSESTCATKAGCQYGYCKAILESDIDKCIKETSYYACEYINGCNWYGGCQGSADGFYTPSGASVPTKCPTGYKHSEVHADSADDCWVEWNDVKENGTENCFSYDGEKCLNCASLCGGGVTECKLVPTSATDPTPKCDGINACPLGTELIGETCTPCKAGFYGGGGLDACKSCKENASNPYVSTLQTAEQWANWTSPAGSTDVTDCYKPFCELRDIGGGAASIGSGGKVTLVQCEHDPTKPSYIQLDYSECNITSCSAGSYPYSGLHKLCGDSSADQKEFPGCRSCSEECSGHGCACPDGTGKKICRNANSDSYYVECRCWAGYYKNNFMDYQCGKCGAGYYCPKTCKEDEATRYAECGTERKACPKGQYQDGDIEDECDWVNGGFFADGCQVDADGDGVKESGCVKQTKCPEGYYCPGYNPNNSIQDGQKHKCPGPMTSAAGSDGRDDCSYTTKPNEWLNDNTCELKTTCKASHYCPGSITVTANATGEPCPPEKNRGVVWCGKKPDGSDGERENRAYCPAGATENKYCDDDFGKYMVSNKERTACEPCEPADNVTCSAGQFACDGETTCQSSPPGYYSDGKSLMACPGISTSPEGSKTKSACYVDVKNLTFTDKNGSFKLPSNLVIRYWDLKSK